MSSIDCWSYNGEVKANKGDETVKSGRRKLQFTAEKLRRLMLAWSFEQTGKVLKDNEVKRLSGKHGDEKLQRYNYLCPRCHVIDFIRQEGYETMTSAPLCIDNCINCPTKRHCLHNKEEWTHIAHEDFHRVSSHLNDFVSVYVQRDKMSVIENTVLTLQIRMKMANSTAMKDDSGLTLCDQQWIIKVLKRLWFEKIRTSTVRSTQPLNLTYGRFWIELVTDAAYMSITAHNTQREFQHIPIDSVIGATVDSSMQICLSLQSSFESNFGKNGDSRRVSFDLYLKHEYLKSLGCPIDVKVLIHKNCNRQFHSDSTDAKEAFHFQDINDQFYQLCTGDCNAFNLFSFRIGSKEFQNTSVNGVTYPAIVVDSQQKGRPLRKVWRKFLKINVYKIVCVIEMYVTNVAMFVTLINRHKKRMEKAYHQVRAPFLERREFYRKNVAKKRKHMPWLDDDHTTVPKKKFKYDDKVNSHTYGFVPQMFVFSPEGDRNVPMCSLFPNNVLNNVCDPTTSVNVAPFSSLPQQSRLNTSEPCLTDAIIKTEPNITSTYSLDATIAMAQSLKRDSVSGTEPYQKMDSEKSNTVCKSDEKVSLLISDCKSDKSIFSNNTNDNEEQLKKLCESVKTPSLYDDLIAMECSCLQDVLRIFEEETKANEILRKYCETPFEQLAMIKVSPKSTLLTLESIHQTTLSPKDLAMVRSELPTDPNRSYLDLANILQEEKSNGKTLEQRYDEIQQKVHHKQVIVTQKSRWENFLQRWQKWNIEDFQTYLIRIDRQRFEKYFKRIDDFRQLWYATQKKEFVGELLAQLDRETLEELGVKDKNDRKILFESIALLKKDNNNVN
ncbi:hypothetical protein RFI_32917 [Reticulomyxa filosa]|uniref:SAM domain-containing protein n=1 Tax=Reticulomyxa filosa TaxID=46433 RepID=X6LTP9_RETFI|nr:hypothetical protein RFI_32917 [Reticulomyxa filosa]|eukprot:ETO04482.1 hypothetical protein RFI_32917 [Reticulomyxa filosa]